MSGVQPEHSSGSRLTFGVVKAAMNRSLRPNQWADETRSANSVKNRRTHNIVSVPGICREASLRFSYFLPQTCASTLDAFFRIACAADL